MAISVDGDTILRLENVSVSYEVGTVQVLKNVNAIIHDRLQPGGPIRPQIVAFIGPSGAGKTTLFRSIAGVETPTVGSVFVGIDGVKVKPGMIGVVSQDYIVFDYFTVLENLMLPARLAGMSSSQARDKAMGFLNRFGLGKVVHSYPTKLSGGQRQRLAILRQLMSSTPTAESGSILLMDEPFSGLDPVAKNSVCQLIMEVAQTQEKNTVIVTSHDIHTALKIADTVWVLGRDRDDKNEPIPGAYIKSTYDLVSLGLAWEPGISGKQAFHDLEVEIEHLFETI